ncbi:MAG: nicotinate-nucleotide adenylyltransferase, partial [Candidatus Omnitrophota bacterium]|nr:nicotinate-nucleotide adenylyltransferase [Candidatus Omnitrophota bacterium]
MKIGILGGTFNPLHVGHLAIAEAIRDKINLDKVIFVPSYIPPHKSKIKLAAAGMRFKMVKAGIKGNPNFSVSDSEIIRQGKSYSVDTLRYFRKLYRRKAKLYFIIGADSLPELKTWREIRAILKLARFVVVNRPGYAIKNLP